MNAKLKEFFSATDDVAAYTRSVAELMAAMVSAIDLEGVARLTQAVEETKDHDGTIFTFGNGGSAVVASHFVNDMGVNSLVDGKRGYRVISLADSFACVTAVANDVTFDEVFVRRLRCDMQTGDLCIGLSVSGNSENVVRALQFAKDHDGRTFAISGFDGGRVREASDDSIHIPSSLDEYGPVEDAFSIIFHMVSSWLTMKQGRFLHH
jgi:D-sedoheptulose 7-phosphate isomerase